MYSTPMPGLLTRMKAMMTFIRPDGLAVPEVDPAGDHDEHLPQRDEDEGNRGGVQELHPEVRGDPVVEQGIDEEDRDERREGEKGTVADDPAQQPARVRDARPGPGSSCAAVPFDFSRNDVLMMFCTVTWSPTNSSTIPPSCMT